MKRNRSFSFVLLVALALIGAYGQTHEHEQMSYEIKHRGRLYWQMPRRVAAEIGIEKGMQVADIGCGDGYFTLLLAEKVGESGHVYAEDIDADALAILEERKRKAGHNNVTLILGAPEDPMLPEGRIDIALIVNSLHYLKDLKTFFEHLEKSLKPDGKLVIVQWAAEKMDPELPGWEGENREQFTLQRSLSRIYEAGWEVVEQPDFLPMQYLFICRPSF